MRTLIILLLLTIPASAQVGRQGPGFPHDTLPLCKHVVDTGIHACWVQYPLHTSHGFSTYQCTKDWGVVKDCVRQ